MTVRGVAVLVLVGYFLLSAIPGPVSGHTRNDNSKTSSKASNPPPKPKFKKAKPRPRRKINPESKRTTDISPLPAIMRRLLQDKNYQKLLDVITAQKYNLGSRRPFLEGYALFQLKRYRESISKWSDALRRTPVLQAHIFYFQALAAEALNDDETAHEALENLIRHEPTGLRSDMAYEALARIALRQDKPLEAARWFEHLLKRFPNHENAPTFLAERAYALEKAGRNREAALAWRKLWSRYPENKDADFALEKARNLALGLNPPLREMGARDHYLRAQRLQKSYFYNKAFKAYRELTRLFPNSPYQRDIAINEALTIYSLRETDKAHFALSEAIDLFPPNSSDRAKARYYLARNHLRRRDQSAFKMEIRTLLEESPKSRWAARARYLMGRVYEDDLEFESAERFYQQVVKRHPRSYLAPIARWQLSWIQFQRKAYSEAFQGFRNLARQTPNHQLAPSALFWAGVSAERNGERENAITQYKKCVTLFRHLYYGQLSEKALRRIARKKPSFTSTLSSNRTAGYKEWIQPPNGYLVRSRQNRWEAAELLSSMEFYDLAGEEYERVGNSPYFLYRAALSYSRDGQHGKANRILSSYFLEAIQAGGRDLPKEFWKVAFPLLAKKRVKGGVDPLLVNSIIKAESLFEPDAFSSAGAMGLMQLMPATGRRVAKKLKVRLRSTDQLFDPKINLRLGSYHLGELIRDFKGELVPAIASYNAGRGAVKRWWRNRQNDSIETFIERIPYQETRGYVKKVLGYLQEYRRIYGNTQPPQKKGPVR